MRIVKLLLFALVALIVLPRCSFGQGCTGIMTPNFSTYLTITNDASYVYSTVLVDGYASIHPSEYCTIPPGTTHEGRPYNKIGTVGGTIDGSPVCPSCYISVSNPQYTTLDVEVLEDYEGVIFCSDIGDFYDHGGTEELYNVPKYTASCTITPPNLNLQCGFGGPDTICNPTIKASATYPSGSIYSCVSTCVHWVSNGEGNTKCCAPSVEVDADCTTIFSSAFVTTVGGT